MLHVDFLSRGFVFASIRREFGGVGIICSLALRRSKSTWARCPRPGGDRAFSRLLARADPETRPAAAGRRTSRARWHMASRRSSKQRGAPEADGSSRPALITAGSSSLAADRRGMKHHVIPRRLANRAPWFQAVPVVHQQRLRVLALLPEDLRRRAMELRREIGGKARTVALSLAPRNCPPCTLGRVQTADGIGRSAARSTGCHPSIRRTRARAQGESSRRKGPISALGAARSLAAADRSRRRRSAERRSEIAPARQSGHPAAGTRSEMSALTSARRSARRRLHPESHARRQPTRPGEQRPWYRRHREAAAPPRSAELQATSRAASTSPST